MKAGGNNIIIVNEQVQVIRIFLCSSYLTYQHIKNHQLSFFYNFITHGNCHYYFQSCAAVKRPTHVIPKHTCIKAIKSGNHGYAVIDSCPPYNTDSGLEYLCTAKSSTADLFGMLPVSDLQNNTTYKNVFCARCNHASNQTLWKFSASCKGLIPADLPQNRSLMLQFIIEKCEWRFKPPREQKRHLKRCLAIERTCPDSALVEKEPFLPALCSFYAFPVCRNIQIKNPHCDICKGKDISAYSCYCKISLGKSPSSGILPLDILFDFSSTSHTVQVGNKKTVVKNKECDKDFVFDPFSEKCTKIHVHIVPERILDDGDSIKSLENKTYVNSSENGTYINDLENGTFINCSFVEMNISSATLFSNGSMWIPLHKRIYDNESYIIKDSRLFLCADFKRSYATTETFALMKIIAIQIITYIGLTTSMLCLMLLLGIYIAVAELRTLPGKKPDQSVMCDAFVPYPLLIDRSDRQTIPLHDGFCSASLLFAVFVLLDGRYGFRCRKDVWNER